MFCCMFSYIELRAGFSIQYVILWPRDMNLNLVVYILKDKLYGMAMIFIYG